MTKRFILAFVFCCFAGTSVFAHPSDNPIMILDQDLIECSDELPRANFFTLGELGGRINCPQGGLDALSDKRAGGTIRILALPIDSWNHPFFGRTASLWLTISLADSAEYYEISDDGTSVLVKMRPGVEFSYPDGRTLSYNADVVVFLAETIFQSDPDDPSRFFFESLSATIHSITRTPEGVPNVEKIDDLMVRISYFAPIPQRVWLELISDIGVYGCTSVHPDAAGVSTEFPALTIRELRELAIQRRDPSLLTTTLSLDTPVENVPSCGKYLLDSLSEEEIVLRKNPHAIWVDEKGRTLPLIDTWRGKFTEVDANLDLRQADRFINGDTDFINVSPRTVPSIRTFASANEQILFDVGDPDVGNANWMMLNQDVGLAEGAAQDPQYQVKRTLFRNPVFRRALSKLIDRQAIVDIAWSGYNSPQFGPGSSLLTNIQLDRCPVAEIESVLASYCERFRHEVANSASGLDFNPQNALDDLESIGLFDRDGDGILDVLPFFGQIAPGPDGIYQSVPQGDDFWGPTESNKMILSGPNGVLDSNVLGDDVAITAQFEGDVKFTILTNDNNVFRIAEIEEIAKTLSENGILASANTVSFFEIVRFFFTPGSAWDAIRLGQSESTLNGQMRHYSSCDPIFQRPFDPFFGPLYKPSNCDAATGQKFNYAHLEPVDDREPFQHLIDNMKDFGIPNDPITGRNVPSPLDPFLTAEDDARLSVEYQILGAENLPSGPYLNYPQHLQAYRADRIGNAANGIFDIDGKISNMLVFYSIDAQN